MKLTFLGSGSAFTVGAGNYQSNMVLESAPGKLLLIDCGSDVRWSLYDQGVSYKTIDAVFISHLHSDHTGGLDWLAFSTYFDKTCKKPSLFVHKAIAGNLWKKVLSGALDSLEDKKAELSSYFALNIIKKNAFTWSGIDFQLIPTTHFMSNHQLNPSYGLFFESSGKAIFLTLDTQFTPDDLMEYYKKADLIFHDCETQSPPSSVHAHYKQLKRLDPSIKKKMWLYHYNPGPLPDPLKDGFLGFVKKGQEFEI